MHLRHPAIAAIFIAQFRNLRDPSQRSKWPYQAKVVNTSVLNASAIPGGFLYINRGLLELVDDENEMVGVMAHEVGMSFSTTR
ncbi:MAG: M48 family metalloprotease [Alloacidobacterium sp.]|jgi:predicted Zn-dependent protease